MSLVSRSLAYIDCDERRPAATPCARSTHRVDSACAAGTVALSLAKSASRTIAGHSPGPDAVAHRPDSEGGTAGSAATPRYSSELGSCGAAAGSPTASTAALTPTSAHTFPAAPTPSTAAGNRRDMAGRSTAGESSEKTTLGSADPRQSRRHRPRRAHSDHRWWRVAGFSVAAGVGVQRVRRAAGGGNGNNMAAGWFG